MVFAHTATVLDSFLMYSARALLNHYPHLKLFLNKADKIVRNNLDRTNLLAAKWIEEYPDSRKGLQVACSSSCGENDVSEPQNNFQIFFNHADNTA